MDQCTRSAWCREHGVYPTELETWKQDAIGGLRPRQSLSPVKGIPRLFSDLALARGDGRYARLMRAVGGVKLLILDDWG